MTNQRRVQLQMLSATSLNEIDAAVTALMEKRPHALMVTSDPFYLTRPNEIVASIARLALPAIYPFREFPAAGGLISYGTNRAISYRQAGVYAARILKGTKPADLPVMQPATFELLINLRTAQALGLTIPPTLLALADEVTSLVAMQRYGSDRRKSGHGGRPLKMTLMTQLGRRGCVAAIDDVKRDLG